MTPISEVVIRAVIALIEAVPEIIEVIKSHPELDLATKIELTHRVEAARAKVNAVKVQDV